MTKIDTIVLDVDGTLLNSEKKLTAKTKEALIKVQEHGVTVVLASGRPTPGMGHLVHELEMDKHHGLIISFNGASVIDCQTKEVLYSQPIDLKIGKELLEHLKKFEVIPMIFDDVYMYVNNVFGGMIDTSAMFNENNKKTNIIEYESRGGKYLLCEKEDLAAFADFPLYKVLIAAEPTYLKEHYLEIMDPFKESLNCVFSAPFYFEFTDQGVDKAATLNSVLLPLGHLPETTMAFGDGHNDITMLEYAGVGVAMANAEEDVLRIADESTRSNNDDGIAYKLYDYFPEIFGK